MNREVNPNYTGYKNPKLKKQLTKESVKPDGHKKERDEKPKWLMEERNPITECLGGNTPDLTISAKKNFRYTP